MFSTAARVPALRMRARSLALSSPIASVTADRAGEVERHEGRLALPAAAVPMHPGAPERDVAQMVAVAAGELRS